MTGAFLLFHRNNKPLSQYLYQSYERAAQSSVLALGPDQLNEPEAVVHQLIRQYESPPPTVGALRPGRTSEGAGFPSEDLGSTRPTIRRWVRFEVEGDVEALNHWPDQDGEPQYFRTVDENLPSPTPPPPGEPDNFAMAVGRHEALIADHRWIVAGPDDPQREQGLHTFVEILVDDVMKAGEDARMSDLSARLDQSMSDIKPIIEAIQAQHREYFTTILPSRLRELVNSRRQWFRGLQMVDISLGFPPEWKANIPAVREIRSGNDGSRDEDNSGAEPQLAPPAQEVELPQRARLVDASFDDLLRTTRMWANAVSRHPLAYRKLEEERISDLLAASLNAALPGAQREVFTRGGKADIFVRANALPNGPSAEKIFVGECKKIGGPGKACEALDQLLGYLEAHDTAALLVLLVENKKFFQGERAALARLRARDDFREDLDEIISGWPVLSVESEAGSLVRVCVAAISISEPPPHPKSTKASNRSSRR